MVHPRQLYHNCWGLLFGHYHITAIISVHRRLVTTGWEGLIWQTAAARAVLDPKGNVFIEGGRWNAVAEDGRIEAGEEIAVTQVEALTLKVTGRPSRR
jgi:membrane-bound ClpP family serine protease